MSTLKVVNFENLETGTVDLHDIVTESNVNPFTIKDVVVNYQSVARQGTHKVKNRSDVKGSRKKLFRQKGTGSARAGSAQSPIRRHGGVAFGPVPGNRTVAVNKKIKKKALASVIGLKIKNNELIVVDNLKLPDHKTKNLVTLFKNLRLDKTLVVFSEEEKNFALASRNLQSVKCVHSSGLNIFDALNYKYLLITRDALMDVEGRLLK